ncbi:MAG: SDR family oxidoreductase [Bacteroidales bacterium]|jgi:short-subunit dehydrogenase|nr:SDR family oxidoreductase [Bacteroidales bacterium]
MSTFKNKKVLITGAASGIGKIMCRLALEKGANIVMIDINKEALERVKTEFSSLGQLYAYPVDVSDLTQITQMADTVKKEVGKIDILINNAGIVVGKYFNEHSLEQIEKTMAVNSLAPQYITHFFLQEMIDHNEGHICTISSMAGLISNPKMAVYVASKWAAAGWSDSLRLEMKQLHKKVKITTILPYYINTGMFDGVKSLIPILEPEKTAKKIIRAIEKEKIYLGMPWGFNFVRTMQGLLPIRLFDLIVGKWMGVYTTMNHFTGHQNK